MKAQFVHRIKDVTGEYFMVKVYFLTEDRKQVATIILSVIAKNAEEAGLKAQEYLAQEHPHSIYEGHIAKATMLLI